MCISWCADLMTLRNARCDDKDIIKELETRSVREVEDCRNNCFYLGTILC